jgi:hypothetical protein
MPKKNHARLDPRAASLASPVRLVRRRLRDARPFDTIEAMQRRWISPRRTNTHGPPQRLARPEGLRGRPDQVKSLILVSILAAATACAEAHGGGGAAGGGGGTAGTGGGAPLSQAVGLPCEQDADCPAEGTVALVCIQSTADAVFGSGGPQGGYCSYPCGSDADCEAVDDLSACDLTPGGTSYCLARCRPGRPGATEDLLKCGANRAQACVDILGGLCFPRCQSDARCGPERSCDPGASGLCQSTPRPGGGVGAACDLATAEQDCASGICLEFPDASGRVAGSSCSAACTYATSDGCGYDAQTGGQRAAACLQPQLDSGGPGDLGFCFELCDLARDCQQPGWVCRPLGGGAQALGRTGECVPSNLAVEPSADAGAPD